MLTRELFLAKLQTLEGFDFDWTHGPYAAEAGDLYFVGGKSVGANAPQAAKDYCAAVRTAQREASAAMDDARKEWEEKNYSAAFDALRRAEEAEGQFGDAPTYAELVQFLERGAERLSFGEPNIEFDTNGGLHEGGWINVTVPIMVDGAPFGEALIGAWVHTNQTGAEGKSKTIFDRCQRAGFAIEAYQGNDRRFEPAAGAPDIDLGELFPEATDVEEALLDAAVEAATIDYEDIYAAALRSYIESKMKTNSTYTLILQASQLS